MAVLYYLKASGKLSFIQQDNHSLICAPSNSCGCDSKSAQNCMNFIMLRFSIIDTCFDANTSAREHGTFCSCESSDVSTRDTHLNSQYLATSDEMRRSTIGPRQKRSYMSTTYTITHFSFESQKGFTQILPTYPRHEVDVELAPLTFDLIASEFCLFR